MEAKLGDVMKNGDQETDQVKNMKEISKNTAPQQVRSWSPNQLTIFYGGRVHVFESISADKVGEIMFMAAKISGIKYSPVLTRSPSLQSSTANAYVAPHIMYPIHQNNALCNLQAELPIPRRHSLQRFFEKRRDRLVNKAPYRTNVAGGKESSHTHAVASPEAA